MPLFTYKCQKCGHEVEALVRGKRGRPKKCKNCGSFGLERRFRVFHSSGGEGWPMESIALGVNPRQRKQYAEMLAKKGVPTDVNERGRPVFTSPQHRKRVCEAVGAFDMNAGYGDPTPKTPILTEKERDAKAAKELRKKLKPQREKALRAVKRIYNQRKRRSV